MISVNFEFMSITQYKKNTQNFSSVNQKEILIILILLWSILGYFAVSWCIFKFDLFSIYFYFSLATVETGLT